MRKSIPALTVALAATLILPAAVLAHWPVANDGSRVTQGYSAAHRAYDISSSAGTRVVPSRSGRVAFAGYKRNCGGYQVYVSHGRGLYSAYFHLRAEYVRKGQWVTSQRTLLGRVGETGCTTGPHLHFEIWHGYPWSQGSYRVNPWRYMDSGIFFPRRYR